MPLLFICASILFGRFWIIFTTITLNSFLGRLPVSLFIWSYGFLQYSLICCMFLSFFNLFDLLYLPSPFCWLQGHVPLVCEVCPSGWGCLCALREFPLGEIGVCPGECSWVSSLWRAVPRSVVCFFWVVWFGMALGSLLLMGNVVFLFN